MFLVRFNGPGTIRALREGGTRTELVSDAGARVFVDEHAIRLLGCRLTLIDDAAPVVAPEPEPEPVAPGLPAWDAPAPEPGDDLAGMTRAQLWRAIKDRGLRDAFAAAGLKYQSASRDALLALLRTS